MKKSISYLFSLVLVALLSISAQAQIKNNAKLAPGEYSFEGVPKVMLTVSPKGAVLKNTKGLKKGALNNKKVLDRKKQVVGIWLIKGSTKSIEPVKPGTNKKPVGKPSSGIQNNAKLAPGEYSFEGVPKVMLTVSPKGAVLKNTKGLKKGALNNKKVLDRKKQVVGIWLIKGSTKSIEPVN